MNIKSTAPILEFSGIDKVFNQDIFKPKRQTLFDVSFHIAPNLVTGLIGHNGAGKTTLIKILFRLMFASSGEIRYKNHPIERKDFLEFGYMPEINKLPLSLTPIEIIRTHLKLMNRKADMASIMAALEQVDLGKFAHLPLGKMSKGMQRRVAWVQANIHDPQILVLDEPFSGLDPFGKTLLQTWIHDLKGKDKTMILCTHDIMAIQSLCDETVILKEGKVIYNSYTIPESSASNVYQITVTGIRDQDLGDMLKLLPIKSECTRTSIDFQHKINFKNYDDSMKTLRFLEEKGVIINKFESLVGREAFLKTNLMEFFRRG